MNDSIIDKVDGQIDRFNQRIDNIKNNFDHIEPTGRYTARSLLVQRYNIRHLLKWLEEGEDASQLRHNFIEANARFRKLQAEKEDEYLEKLREEFQYLLEKYPSLICHFMMLDPIDMELENHLDIRDAIEIVMLELDEFTSIYDAQLKVEALDEVFECEYRKNLRKILEIVESEYGPEIEKPYFPSRFWWRHPSEHERWWEWEFDENELANNGNNS